VIPLLATLLAQENEGSPFGLLILIIPVAALLYMSIVPQRKARAKQAEMLRTIDVGDEVLTTGGIVGVITFVEDELYHLEVDNDVVIRIAKTAVARTTSEPDPSERPASRSRKGLLSGAADTASKSAGDQDRDQDGEGSLEDADGKAESNPKDTN
jgi:preprotein translocase subunit YajC